MDRLRMHSRDLTQDNVVRLALLFPECVTEVMDDKGGVVRKIDFDLLRQELSDHVVEGPAERYQLTWPGKAEAVLAANAPIAKTLRPDRDDSVDFDNTRNLFIEGDNLDALKLLQETYLSTVNVIYIDPPYNTGKEMVYSDDYGENTADFLRRSNQRDESENRLTANPETSGRFHSLWLSMIYPRLRLARNLLRDDGVILISIDDGELPNLRRMCDEIFGSQNFIACMVWEKGRKNDATLVSVGHEYVLIYAKSVNHLKELKVRWREEKPGAREIWEKYIELRSLHGEDNAAIEEALQAWFSALPGSHPSKKWNRYRRVDEHGPWRDRDISWPGGGGPRYDVLHPVTGRPCKVPERGWIYASPEEMQRQISLGLVEFREDHTEPPIRKAHLRPVPEEALYRDDSSDEEEVGIDYEPATQVRGTYFYKQSQVAVRALRDLMGAKVFNNPKDHQEIARLIDYVTAGVRDAIVMDFFAGSGTTAHSVWELNSRDGGSRRFILVQLPESLDLGKSEQRTATEFCDEIGRPRTIAELAKERLRRAGRQYVSPREAGGPASQMPLPGMPEEVSSTDRLDVGFRVLKVDTSNMEDVYYQPGELTQDKLFEVVENIKPDRTPEDLLFQVMLDLGVDLAASIAVEEVAGKQVYFVADTELAACFEKDVTEDLLWALAARKPARIVFRDAGFASDDVKINAEQIFKLLSPSTELRVI